MKVTLDKENRFLTKEGLLDIKRELIYAGTKAAWCFKDGTATPENIRNMPEIDLLRRGIETYINDHGTPDEHDKISLEITEFPKLMCMILNSEHQYTACERSFRYTKITTNDYISDIEVKLYNKWYNIFINIFEENYSEWFYQVNQKNEKNTKTDMRKKAQENARYFVSVLTPTSIAYSAPWYQWQKLATFLQDMIENPNTSLKKIVVPYAKEFIEQLIELKVVVLTKDAIALYPPLEKMLKEKNDNREWLYKNNKETKLYMFAENNPFSGINKPNEYNASINYNSRLSIAGFADILRHRTSYVALKNPNEFSYIIPKFVPSNYWKEYDQDMQKINGIYPQGQLIDFNLDSSIYRLVQYMGKERACERPQQEVEDWYVNQLLPDIVEGLSKRPEYEEEYKLLRTRYLDKCRCAYPNYHCPNPCGHPRTKRPF